MFTVPNHKLIHKKIDVYGVNNVLLVKIEGRFGIPSIIIFIIYLLLNKPLY